MLNMGSIMKHIVAFINGISSLSSSDGKPISDPEFMQSLTSRISGALANITSRGGVVEAAENACKLVDTGNTTGTTEKEFKILHELLRRSQMADKGPIDDMSEKGDDNGGSKHKCPKKDRTPLMEAAASGHSEVVELLLQHKAKVNAKSSTGQTALMEACYHGHHKVVEILLKNGADKSMKNDKNMLALHEAAVGGHLKIVEMLINAGQDINEQSGNGEKQSGNASTALMEAAGAGHLGLVNWLLEKGADICVNNPVATQGNEEPSDEEKETTGSSALHYAAAGGHEAIVLILLARGAPIERQNENGHTPLMEAASNGHTHLVNLFLNNGAQINTHSKDFKESALTLASYKGHLETVKFLLRKGADHEHKTDEMHTALMEACMDGHTDVAAALLDHGAQVNMPPESYESPLTLAACGGHMELTNLLIQRGADPHETNDEGYTPLMEACREGHDRIVKMLIQHGAAVNVETEETHETALTLASCGGYLETAELLVKAGADVEKGGTPPLLEASQEGHLDCVKFLLSKNASINAQGSNNGDTALSFAAENNHEEVCELLLDNGAAIDVATNDGITPLLKASRGGNLALVQLFAQRGADLNKKSNSNDQCVLSVACAGGHFKIAKFLLQAGADPNVFLKDGTTILMEATKNGHTAIVNMLLDYPKIPDDPPEKLDENAVEEGEETDEVEEEDEAEEQQQEVQNVLEAGEEVEADDEDEGEEEEEEEGDEDDDDDGDEAEEEEEEEEIRVPADGSVGPHHSRTPFEIDGNPPIVFNPMEQLVGTYGAYGMPVGGTDRCISPNTAMTLFGSALPSLTDLDLPAPHLEAVSGSDGVSWDQLRHSFPLAYYNQAPPLLGIYGLPPTFVEGGACSGVQGVSSSEALDFSLQQHLVFSDLNHADYDEGEEGLADSDTGVEGFEFQAYRKLELFLKQIMEGGTDEEKELKRQGLMLELQKVGSLLLETLPSASTSPSVPPEDYEDCAVPPVGAVGPGGDGMAAHTMNPDDFHLLSEFVRKSIDFELQEPQAKIPNGPLLNADHLPTSQDRASLEADINTWRQMDPKGFTAAMYGAAALADLERASSSGVPVMDGSEAAAPPMHLTVHNMPEISPAQFLEETLNIRVEHDTSKKPQKVRLLNSSSGEARGPTAELTNGDVAQMSERGVGEGSADVQDDDVDELNDILDQMPLSQRHDRLKMKDKRHKPSHQHKSSYASSSISVPARAAATEDIDLSAVSPWPTPSVVPSRQPYLEGCDMIQAEYELHGDLQKRLMVAKYNLFLNPSFVSPYSQFMPGYLATANKFIPVSGPSLNHVDLKMPLPDTGVHNYIPASYVDAFYLPSALVDNAFEQLKQCQTQLKAQVQLQTQLKHELEQQLKLQEEHEQLTEQLKAHQAGAGCKHKHHDKNTLLALNKNTQVKDNVQQRPVTKSELQFKLSQVTAHVNDLNQHVQQAEWLHNFRTKMTPQEFVFKVSMLQQSAIQSSSLGTYAYAPSSPQILFQQQQQQQQLNILNQMPPVPPPGASNLVSGSTTMSPGSVPVNQQMAQLLTRQDLMCQSTHLQHLLSLHRQQQFAQVPLQVPLVVPTVCGPECQHDNVKKCKLRAHQLTTEQVQQLQQLQYQQQQQQYQQQQQVLSDYYQTHYGHLQQVPDLSSCPMNSQQQSTLVTPQSPANHPVPQPAAGVPQPKQESTPQTPTQSPASPEATPPTYPPTTDGNGVEINHQTESNHDTALTLACAGGHLDLVNVLISRGANIEHRDKKGFTPLILAATAGHHKICEVIIDHKADLETQSERTKDTALSLACSGGRYEVVELLLKRGANKEHRNVSDYTPLSLAASGGYVHIIKLLLEHNAEINSRTGSKLGISPLMLAAMNGHGQAVKLLLDKGSDINAQIETNRNTALTLACFQGRHEVVSLLVERRANIEHRAKTGLTPLMEAASGGYVEVGKVLLHKMADINASPVPASRDTALTIACDKGHTAFVDLLVSHGAVIEVKNKKGNSPLWLACNGGHLEIVSNLVNNYGANVDSEDKHNISCLMAAFRKGHIKVVNFLLTKVQQFPSDQDCIKFISNLSDKDKELRKKCEQCKDSIMSAKTIAAERATHQAEELLKDLEETKKIQQKEKERQQKKKQEKRKQKKEKKEQSKMENGAAGKQKPEDDGKSKEEGQDEDENYNLSVLVKSSASKTSIESKPVTANGATSHPSSSSKKSASATNVASSAAPVLTVNTSANKVPAAATAPPPPSSGTSSAASIKQGSSAVASASSSSTSSMPVSNGRSKKSRRSRRGGGSSQEGTPPAPPEGKATPAIISPPSAKAAEKSPSQANHAVTTSQTPSQPPARAAEKPGKSSPPGLPPAQHSSASSAATKQPLTAAAVVAGTASQQQSANRKRQSANTHTAVPEASTDDSNKSHRQAANKTPSKQHTKGSHHSGESATTVNRSSSFKGGSLTAPSPSKRSSKRDEDWREVKDVPDQPSRRTKKINVPRDMVSRIIGKGGCNINAVRSMSKAQVDLDKSKDAGDKVLTIRGPSEAVSYASELFMRMLTEPEKDMDQILHNKTPASSSSQQPTPILSAVWHNSMAGSSGGSRQGGKGAHASSSSTSTGKGGGGGSKRQPIINGPTHNVPPLMSATPVTNGTAIWGTPGGGSLGSSLSATTTAGPTMAERLGASRQLFSGTEYDSYTSSSTTNLPSSGQSSKFASPLPGSNVNRDIFLGSSPQSSPPLEQDDDLMPAKAIGDSDPVIRPPLMQGSLYGPVRRSSSLSKSTTTMSSNVPPTDYSLFNSPFDFRENVMPSGHPGNNTGPMMTSKVNFARIVAPATTPTSEFPPSNVPYPGSANPVLGTPVSSSADSTARNSCIPTKEDEESLMAKAPGNKAPGSGRKKLNMDHPSQSTSPPFSQPPQLAPAPPPADKPPSLFEQGPLGLSEPNGPPMPSSFPRGPAPPPSSAFMYNDAAFFGVPRPPTQQPTSQQQQQQPYVSRSGLISMENFPRPEDLEDGSMLNPNALEFQAGALPYGHNTLNSHDLPGFNPMLNPEAQEFHAPSPAGFGRMKSPNAMPDINPAFRSELSHMTPAQQGLEWMKSNLGIGHFGGLGIPSQSQGFGGPQGNSLEGLSRAASIGAFGSSNLGGSGFPMQDYSQPFCNTTTAQTSSGASMQSDAFHNYPFNPQRTYEGAMSDQPNSDFLRQMSQPPPPLFPPPMGSFGNTPSLNTQGLFGDPLWNAGASNNYDSQSQQTSQTAWSTGSGWQP